MSHVKTIQDIEILLALSFERYFLFLNGTNKFCGPEFVGSFGMSALQRQSLVDIENLISALRHLGNGARR